MLVYQIGGFLFLSSAVDTYFLNLFVDFKTVLFEWFMALTEQSRVHYQICGLETCGLSKPWHHRLTDPALKLLLGSPVR